MEPQTFGFRAPMLYHWAIETLRMTEVYYQVHMTRILHTAKTSEKNIFLCFFTELKTYHLSYSLIPDDFRRSVGYYLDI